MLDAAFIEKCADPGLKPRVVEQFVIAAGSSDPLSVTVKSGNRLILVPRANTPEEALEIIRQHVGHAVVRVGVTQYPAGVGVKDASNLTVDLVDACKNLGMGTSMFAKIMRIVAQWYGNPSDKDVQPQILDDAIYAWRTGQFEGTEVFQEANQGEEVHKELAGHQSGGAEAQSEIRPEVRVLEPAAEEMDLRRAGMRIDLSRIGSN